MSISDMPLGRVAPADWDHIDKYPLRGLTAESRPVSVPVTWGINWYTAFDTPERMNRRWWIGRGDLGSIRGGHSVCTPPRNRHDKTAWWDFYDQGQEGACVGFASSRMMTLLNRRQYAALWLYREAQKIDDWASVPHEGTTVRAAMEILRTQGHCRYCSPDQTDPPLSGDGISAYRWATTVDEVLEALGPNDYASIGGIPILNSWGRNYPHKVWIPLHVVERLIAEDGEVALVTDR